LVQRLLTADGADGDVAGNADSVFAIFGFRPTRDLPPFTLIAVLTPAREGERRQ
jgi:hypothetical protein